MVTDGNFYQSTGFVKKTLFSKKGALLTTGRFLHTFYGVLDVEIRPKYIYDNLFAALNVMGVIKQLEPLGEKTNLRQRNCKQQDLDPTLRQGSTIFLERRRLTPEMFTSGSCFPVTNKLRSNQG